MVDKGEKLWELLYTSVPGLSIKNLFSGFANAILTLFPWNKSNTSTTRAPIWGEKEVSALENTCVLVVVVITGSRTNKAQWEKTFFFFFGKKGEKQGEKNTSWRLWQALQIGTALSTAFHGFLESFQRRIFFGRDGLSFLLFKAIFVSSGKLLFSFPDSESIDTAVFFLRMSLLAGATCCGC